MLGWMFASGGMSWAYQFLPGGGNSNVGTGVSTQMLAQCPIIRGGTSSADIFSTNPFNVAAQFDATGANRSFSIFPTNFWMGPSDAIKIKAYQIYVSGKSTVTVTTVNISYSFTTITES